MSVRLTPTVVVLQKDNVYQPYPIDQVRHIAYQLCWAVKCKYITTASSVLIPQLHPLCWKH